MPSQAIAESRVPNFVPLFNPVALRLMRLGVPLGPNALLSVRGRKSGVVRTTPVALVAVGDRRWVVGTFGDVNWVRNLRAAGEGVIGVGRRHEPVKAVELTGDQVAAFFADVMAPYIRRLPLGRWLLGSVLGAPDILDDPVAAAAGRPAFELLRTR
ncbi:MAG: nitroreductase family deazaflavin-dependent oxidoreductase [Candidatus Dormibacteraeota bacterium]|nr:nitroreductase family deazaflavin-dependent oxidoreductase [Candidatus Dormibacteraeota bacterium]